MRKWAQKIGANCPRSLSKHVVHLDCVQVRGLRSPPPWYKDTEADKSGPRSEFCLEPSRWKVRTQKCPGDGGGELLVQPGRSLYTWQSTDLGWNAVPSDL